MSVNNEWLNLKWNIALVLFSGTVLKQCNWSVKCFAQHLIDLKLLKGYLHLQYIYVCVRLKKKKKKSAPFHKEHEVQNHSSSCLGHLRQKKAVYYPVRVPE